MLRTYNSNGRSCMNSFYLGCAGGNHPHGPLELVGIFHRPNDILPESNLDFISIFMKQHPSNVIIDVQR